MGAGATEGFEDRRNEARRLLSHSEPGDALASYYALWHDPSRTRLTIHYDTTGRADGFIAVCQTGADLFRPLVTLRAPNSETVQELVLASLAPDRPYTIIAPVGLASSVREHLSVSHAALECIYSLDPSRFHPTVNVLVQRSTGPDGSPRYQIESSGEVVALSGTNWRSPTFAEVFVYVHPRGRGRGWGQSVASACAADLLAARLRPLYAVREENAGSVRLAREIGFADTGGRQFTGQVALSR